jgi:phage/plasmid-associated DNA primase
MKGPGANGKSFLGEMVRNVLGDKYAVPIPVNTFTEKQATADKADSVAMMASEARAGLIAEPEHGAEFKTNIIKQWLGLEAVSRREQYGRQKIIKFVINLLLMTNHDLDINTSDYGTWRRILYYAFKMSFVANPDPENPYEAKIRLEILHNWVSDPNYLSAMLSILVKHYEELTEHYDGDIMKVPHPTIRSETLAYQNEQDQINRFICQKVVQRNDGVSESYTISQIAKKYISWYASNVTRQTSRLVPKDIIKQLENSRIGKLMTSSKTKERVLNGYYIMDDNDTIEENEYKQLGTLDFESQAIRFARRQEAPEEVYEAPADSDSDSESDVSIPDSDPGDDIADIDKLNSWIATDINTPKLSANSIMRRSVLYKMPDESVVISVKSLHSLLAREFTAEPIGT